MKASTPYQALKTDGSPRDDWTKTSPIRSTLNGFEKMRRALRRRVESSLCILDFRSRSPTFAMFGNTKCERFTA